MALINGTNNATDPPPVTATDMPPGVNIGGAAQSVMDWLGGMFGGGERRLPSLPAEPTRQPGPYDNQEVRSVIPVGGGIWGSQRYMTPAQAADLASSSMELHNETMMAGGTAGGPLAAEARALGRVRNLRNPPATRFSAGYETIDPDVPEPPPQSGIGHNQPPEPIWMTEGGAGPVAPLVGGRAATGRMGVNADAEFARMGLPAYGDIVPSANSGPVTLEQIKAGAPVGRVFDLSETYKVPLTPQESLPRIDPDAGKRRGLPQNIQDIVGDQDLRGKLRTVAEAGLRVGGAYWYNADPLRQAFISELGPQDGAAQFNRYMSIIGAVSAGSDVGQNIRTASYYLNRERAGNPVQGVQLPNGKWAPIDLESPYGHKMQNTQFGAYRDIEGGEPLDPEMRPKRASFDANLQGNQEPLTIDKHNMRLISMLTRDPLLMKTAEKADANYPDLGIQKGDNINWRQAYTTGQIPMERLLQIPGAWKDVPEPNQYGALENMQKNLAREMGITPAQLQAALWVGGGRVTGLRSLPTSFMGTFENRLQTTANAREITPLEALREFIRGGRPLLTPLAGAGAGLGAAASGGQDDQRQ